MKLRRPPALSAAGLFGDAQPAAKPAPAAFRANIDGGARGNPGPAAYGVVIRDAGGKIVAKLKKYIGRSTNNVAEYYGLIAALDYAQSHGIRALHVETDSELLMKQMRGQYKVKSPDLRPLFERAKKTSQSFDFFRIDHVYREQNAEADALVNEALDETAGVAAKPSASKSSALQQDASNPSSTKTAALPQRASKTAGAKLTGAEPDATKPAAAKSGAAKLDVLKLAAAKLDAAKLAAAKPSPAKLSAPGEKAPAGTAPESGVKAEPRWVRARFRSGILYPLEDIDLEDGAVVDVTFRPIPKPK